ncbi:MAG: globin, partial [Paludibacter sp.]|nr:globin [Paludibacter sp.]
MEFKITKYNFGERPEVTRPDNEFYKQLGDEGIREMISKHYDLLRESSLKDMFPKEEATFEIAKRNSADFFIQICGGPDYFNQNRGKAMMSNRHAPFSITPEGRIVWLKCFREAISE